MEHIFVQADPEDCLRPPVNIGKCIKNFSQQAVDIQINYWLKKVNEWIYK